jgi:hypothetical protein
MASLSSAQTLKTLENKEELTKYEGFFDFWHSVKEDKIYMKVERLDQDFLYVHSFTTGLGSNDIDL